MITCDLFALKNGAKIKKSPAGGMTGNESANQKRNGDVMEMKTRLDDVIRGIKALDTVIFLIPSPAVKEATT